MKKAIEFIIFPFLLSAFSFAIYEQLQPMIDYELCKLCDAIKYKKIYENFINGTFKPVDYPFYTRLLTPFIASIFSKSNAISGFHYTNALFLILTNTTLYYTWKNYLKLGFVTCLIGLVWLNFHWTGIPRYYNLHVVNVDTGAFFFQALTILLLIKNKFKWFLLVVPLAVFQKESYMPIFLII
ncbi:MAG: hypothetical protein NZ521_08640, partial [Flammeovirgaceae bacterium]|nr:hypothetical protein [Flammeovirgaceae bacterium]MDW8288291.1 hypothetical protein [Flammeovirgaceae bacterium]